MLSLTTVQRDLLQLLLTTERPLGAAALGAQLHLTARQIHYGLRDIKGWLLHRQASLVHTPGLGVQVICSSDLRVRLLADLAAQSRFQLVLTPDQRQQLLALVLLAAPDPATLGSLQQELVVARATVLKDLELVEQWLAIFGLQIVRRQHRGCWVAGDELARRQALAALLWGDLPGPSRVMFVQPGRGLVFVLEHDAALLPIVGRAAALAHRWNLAEAQAPITWAEAQLGARFADEAIAPLALALAIQHQRVRAGQIITWDAAQQAWITAQAIWPLAQRLAAQLWPELAEPAFRAETAALVLALLCSPRDEPWPGELASDPAAHALIGELLQQIAAAYAVPELASDQLLRDGLDALILPACVRRRFRLWAPPRQASDTHTERYANERAVAARLAANVAAATGMALPDDARDDLILLLRAAIVRARPAHARQVLVVCPSGMATTQLLVARLRARFPHQGTFEVLPMRELTAERIGEADLIIATVPLLLTGISPIPIVQVHPMLRPEDMAALAQWLV